MLDATRTVREFAVEVPNATRLFEKLGIDYCCGGGKSLNEACSLANIPVGEVLQSIQQATASAAATENDWNTAHLADLIEHVIVKHHAYIKQEVPRLNQLAAKVASVHGKNHPELAQVKQVFGALGAELISHMMKEEQVLFPYVTELEHSVLTHGRQRQPMFGTVRNPIHMMELEHDAAGNLQRELRRLTNDYMPPADGCISYRTLYSALAEFEADLHQHIHLENNILFPRAVELEARR